METIQTVMGDDPSMGSAFVDGLGRETLERLTPAVYAGSPHEKMSSKYAFLPTSSVIDTMDHAGFCVIQARQSHTRKRLPAFAPHALRFRKRKSDVYVGQVVPEILVLNSHDGSSAYHVRIALYRAICSNGMIVGDGSFPTWKVAHRGNAAAEVLDVAMQLASRFGELGAVIERMQNTLLDEPRRLAFAGDALRLRYPDEPVGAAIALGDLLKPRRPEDEGNDVWRVFNVVQEHIISGGIRRRTPTNRIVRTRGIRPIREDVRLYTGLWDRAMREVAYVALEEGCAASFLLSCRTAGAGWS